MRYDVQVEKFSVDGADYPTYGVEVWPPLGAIAAANVCKVLTRDPPEDETNTVRSYDAAYMTRDDAEGTAFVVYPSRSVGDDDCEWVAFDIGHTIDPTGRHQIVLHYPGGEDK